MDNPRIEQTFTYKVPDDWRSTSFTLGKTDTWTYRGPRFLTFEVNLEDGRENGWCLTTAEELERPVALDSVRITIDATESDDMALLAEIGNDCGNPNEINLQFTREWVDIYNVEGYTPVQKPTVMVPRDIYDEFNITYDFETQEWQIPIKSWASDVMEGVTWDNIKNTRDKLLYDSDGMLAEDMPAALKQEILTYRQLLRDMPTALADIPPMFAAQMFPPVPGFMPIIQEP